MGGCGDDGAAISRGWSFRRCGEPHDTASALASPVCSGEPPGFLRAIAIPATPVTLPLYEQEREDFLQFVDARTHQVVTAIELLSPTSKLPGQGRREYEAKRQEVLLTLTHLVEIDLLRGGQPMEMASVPATGYRVLVSREWDRPQAALYAFTLREAPPTVPVPPRSAMTCASAASLGDCQASLRRRQREGRPGWRRRHGVGLRR